MDLKKYYYGLSSERLIFRKLTLNDLNSWVEFFTNNPNLIYLDIYFDRSTRERAKAWIETQIERYMKHEFGHLAILVKNSNEIIGTIGFMIKEECKFRKIFKGTAIKPAFWNKGFGLEASKTIINSVFEDNFADVILGSRHFNNMSSQKLNKSLGFKDFVRITEEAREVAKYKLTRKMWEECHCFYYS